MKILPFSNSYLRYTYTVMFYLYNLISKSSFVKNITYYSGKGKIRVTCLVINFHNLISENALQETVEYMLFLFNSLIISLCKALPVAYSF